MRRSRSRSWRRSELVLDERGEEVDRGELLGLRLEQPGLEGGGHAGAAELAQGALQFDEIHVGISSWVFCGDDVAVVGELADERIDLAERERARPGAARGSGGRSGRSATPQLEGGGAGGVDDGRPVLLGEAEDAEDAAHAGLAVAAVDRRAQRADVGARAGRPARAASAWSAACAAADRREDRAAPAAAWRRCSRRSCPVRGIEEADVARRPTGPATSWPIQPGGAR